MKSKPLTKATMIPVHYMEALILPIGFNFDINLANELIPFTFFCLN